MTSVDTEQTSAKTSVFQLIFVGKPIGTGAGAGSLYTGTGATYGFLPRTRLLASTLAASAISSNTTNFILRNIKGEDIVY